MDVSSYVLLSHEQALRRRLDIAANNLANMSTAGFKREQPVFREYVERGIAPPTGPEKATSFVLDYGTVHDTAQGAFDATGHPLDVMIEGAGYFAVQAPDGTTAYTRSGALHVLDNGTLGTAAGLQIQGEGGSPIAVPPDQIADLSIAPDGTVNGTDGPLGRIAVTDFGTEGSVKPRGDGLYAGSGGTELPATATRLKAGGVEASNVQPIVETNTMVDVLRAYQTSVRMSQGIDDMRQRAIDRLSKPD